jgi:hypothetical protein
MAVYAAVSYNHAGFGAGLLDLPSKALAAAEHMANCVTHRHHLAAHLGAPSK